MSMLGPSLTGLRGTKITDSISYTLVSTRSRFPSSIWSWEFVCLMKKFIQHNQKFRRKLNCNFIVKKMTSKPKSTCIVYWNSTDLTSTNFWHMIIYSIHYLPGNVNKVNNNSSHLHNSPSRHLNPFGSRKACTDNPRLGLAEHMVENFHNCLVEKRYLPTYQVVRISICSIHCSTHCTSYSRFCE
jgi:hypothetical protein